MEGRYWVLDAVPKASLREILDAGYWISAEREELGGKSFVVIGVFVAKHKRQRKEEERDDGRWLMVNGRWRRVDVLRLSSLDFARDDILRLSSGQAQLHIEEGRYWVLDAVPKASLREILDAGYWISAEREELGGKSFVVN